MVYEWVDLHRDELLANWERMEKKEALVKIDPLKQYDKGYQGRLSFRFPSKLQDMAYFRNFQLDPFSVDCNNEIGFAPEFLYESGTPVMA